MDIEKYKLLDNFSNIEEEKRYIFLKEFNEEDIVEYINSNGVQGLNLALTIGNTLMNTQAIVNGLNDDFYKIIVLLNKTWRDNEAINLQNYNIDNGFYRNRLLLLKNGLKKDYLASTVWEYRKNETNLNRLENEKEKAIFISQLEDNDMKLEFLKQIKEKDNRDIIIDSFQNIIESNIEPYVQCVQKMIREYFEDTLGEKLDKKKQDKLRIVFNRTSVMFSDKLDENTFGTSRQLFNDIQVNSRIEKNSNKILQFLIHEYGHAFSYFDYKTMQHYWEKGIEEGTQDLFSELVINHYLEKHKSIEIDGKKIRMDYPVISFSGYEWENGWQRTMAYPLLKIGQADAAIAEYQLGDKSKYLEMTLGADYANSKKKDRFGNPSLDINAEEIYNIHQKDFKKVNKDSIFYRRNWILPIFEIQNKLNDKGVNLFDIAKKQKWLCSYIAEQYFDGRKIYEISEEEFQEFQDLIIAQKEMFIFKYDEYANKTVDELEEDEINEYSFEILNMSKFMWKSLIAAGQNMERVWGKCLDLERKKVEEGQDISQSLRKYKAIIPEYIRILSRHISNENILLLDAVKDLKFAYLEQLEAELNNKEKSLDVIKILTDEKTGEFFMDSDITKILAEHNITFEATSQRNKEFGVQDIIGAAIRGNISIDELTGEFKFIIGEKDLSR